MKFRALTSLSRRTTSTLIHLLITSVVAGSAAIIVFSLWYPYPYRIISGGQSIFSILVTVDVILGPLLTFVVATKAKPTSTLVKDLGMIALLQIAALGYGISTVFEARPVHVVFERDRFQVVHAIEIPPNELEMAPMSLRELPLTGPTLLSLRAFRDEREAQELTFQSLVGITLSAQPSMWIPYDASRREVLAKAQSVGQLKTLFPSKLATIDQAVTSSGASENALVYLPLVSRQAFWTVLIDKSTAQPVGYVDIDPYEATATK